MKVDMAIARTIMQGRILAYKIGAEYVNGHVGQQIVPVVPFDQDDRPGNELAFGYGNLLDELFNAKTGHGSYAPYKRVPGSTADEWGEGLIDVSRQDGLMSFRRNYVDQVERRLRERFSGIEFDNPDSHKIKLVLEAHDYAADRGLLTIAKNPLLTDAPEDYILHRSVCCMVVERARLATPEAYHALRTRVGLDDLPVYFVYHAKDDASARQVAQQTANQIEHAKYQQMHVSFSASKEDEYVTAEIII